MDSVLREKKNKNAEVEDLIIHGDHFLTFQLELPTKTQFSHCCTSGR